MIYKGGAEDEGARSVCAAMASCAVQAGMPIERCLDAPGLPMQHLSRRQRLQAEAVVVQAHLHRAGGGRRGTTTRGR